MKKRKNKPLHSPPSVHAQTHKTDPREHAKVWAKIADQRVAQEKKSPPRATFESNAKSTPLPPRTVSIVLAVTILAGFCGGWLHGRTNKARLAARLQSDYVSSISPYSPPKESPR